MVLDVLPGIIYQFIENMRFQSIENNKRMAYLPSLGRLCHIMSLYLVCCMIPTYVVIHLLISASKKCAVPTSLVDLPTFINLRVASCLVMVSKYKAIYYQRHMYLPIVNSIVLPLELFLIHRKVPQYLPSQNFSRNHLRGCLGTFLSIVD